MLNQKYFHPLFSKQGQCLKMKPHVQVNDFRQVNHSSSQAFHLRDRTNGSMPILHCPARFLMLWLNVLLTGNIMKEQTCRVKRRTCILMYISFITIYSTYIHTYRDIWISHLFAYWITIYHMHIAIIYILLKTSSSLFETSAVQRGDFVQGFANQSGDGIECVDSWLSVTSVPTNPFWYCIKWLLV